MYMKLKEIGWTENCGIQNIVIKTLKGILQQSEISTKNLGVLYYRPMGPCCHGMARLQVADGGMASDMEGSCEYIE